MVEGRRQSVLWTGIGGWSLEKIKVCWAILGSWETLEREAERKQNE